MNTITRFLFAILLFTMSAVTSSSELMIDAEGLPNVNELSTAAVAGLSAALVQSALDQSALDQSALGQSAQEFDSLDMMDSLDIAALDQSALDTQLPLVVTLDIADESAATVATISNDIVQTCAERGQLWLTAGCACGGGAGGENDIGSTTWCDAQKGLWTAAECGDQCP